MGDLDSGVKQPNKAAPVCISILVMPGCLASSVAALCDVFDIANALLWQGKDPARYVPRFQVKLVAARPGVIAMSSGLAVLAPELDNQRCDILIVPSVGNCGPDAVNASVAQLQPEIDFVASAMRAGMRTASVCTGTFLVAATGALAQQQVGVSWLFKEVFESTFPTVPLQSNRSIVKSASCHISSGGVASAFDLALELIGEFCEDETRRKIASVLVADAARVARWPVQNTAPTRLAGPDIAEQAKAWISQHAAEQISAATVAASCKVTIRTLARHLKKTFDMTATELIQQERVKLAMDMMKTTQLSFIEITNRCGMSDPATFRKVFKLYAGATPMQYRKRFGNLHA